MPGGTIATEDTVDIAMSEGTTDTGDTIVTSDMPTVGTTDAATSVDIAAITEGTTDIDATTVDPTEDIGEDELQNLVCKRFDQIFFFI